MLSNETIQLKKEILKKNRQAFKGLRESFHFDFQNDYQIFQMEKGFTVNKVKKMLDGNINDYQIAILCTLYQREFMYIATIKNGKFKVGDLTRYKHKLSNFCLKQDFEKYRKYTDVNTYFVVQKTSDLKIKKARDLETTERFSKVKFKEYYDGTISSVSLKQRGFNESRELYGLGYFSIELNEFIDKSGYSTYFYHEKLNERLKEFKEKKLSNELSNFDFSKYEDDVKKELENCKNVICQKMLETNIDYSVLKEYCSLFDALKDVSRSLEYHFINKRDKSYIRKKKKVNDIVVLLVNLKLQIIEIERQAIR